ncbi:MAG: FAD-dependent oxidoreductase [Gemmataceae bacterium]
MRHLSIRAGLLLCVLLGPTRAAEHRADVVIYGATSGGALAAVAAAREGKSVILLHPDRHVGGLITGGLGATDTGNRAGIGGYSREFFHRVREHYAMKFGKDSAQVRDCSEGFRFEPHVAALVLRAMMQEAKVQPLLEQPLDRVEMKGTRLEAIVTTRGDLFRGTIFVDATYEGDLLAKAGVRHHVGREGTEVYGESLAGVQKFSKYHQFPVKVRGLNEEGNLLPLIQTGPLDKPGTGDRKVQAYNFRLCMTDNPANRVPWPRPQDYNAARYEILARYLAARPDVTMGQLMNPIFMPNRKTDTNNNGPISTDHIGANWHYPEGTPAVRARIVRDHVEYTQGLFWFLAHDPRVPGKLQKEINRWGLAKDEFVDNQHWPTQLYIREARRMVGVHVMTEADVRTNRLKDDAIGVGSYNTDSHHVQRVVLEDGSLLNEGDFQVGLRPYAIPYRCLLPRPEQCDNLLVPVCVSSSHVAYGTIRMEPVFMILGQAVGVAASLAIDHKVPVQKVPIDRLQARLRAQKAVLSPEGLSGGASASSLDPARLKGIVVDDTQAKLTGEWKHSSSLGPHVGEGYLHDNDADKGKLRARFVPKLPAAGSYEVRLFYTASSNRASRVTVVVSTGTQEKTLHIDQRKGPRGDTGLLLGTFTFEAGERGWVEIRNDESKGHVIADAVQFLAR